MANCRIYHYIHCITTDRTHRIYIKIAIGVIVIANEFNPITVNLSNLIGFCL